VNVIQKTVGNNVCQDKSHVEVNACGNRRRQLTTAANLLAIKRGCISEINQYPQMNHVFLESLIPFVLNSNDSTNAVLRLEINFFQFKNKSKFAKTLTKKYHTL